jgi:hypothetical protein
MAKDLNTQLHSGLWGCGLCPLSGIKRLENVLETGWFWRMVSSGMLRRVALVRTDVHLVFLRSVRRLLVTANVVPRSPILVTLMKEALSSSDTLVLTRATQRNIPEDAILHSHRRENLKSYMALIPSLGEGRTTPTLLEPLERTNLYQSSDWG